MSQLIQGQGQYGQPIIGVQLQFLCSYALCLEEVSDLQFELMRQPSTVVSERMVLSVGSPMRDASGRTILIFSFLRINIKLLNYEDANSVRMAV